MNALSRLVLTGFACGLVSSCTLEAVDTSVPNGDQIGDPGNPAGDAGPGTQFACDDPVATDDDGEHEAGQPCLGCHSPGGDEEAPPFTIGGTIYSDLVGTAPLVGATIHLIDADGNDIQLISARNGNFWTERPVRFPVKTYAGRCPDVAEMFTPVDQASGNCNTGNCHDSDFRIALPFR